MKRERNLSNKQLMAITHIIGSTSIKEASKKADVSRSTIYKWLKNEDFKNELKRQRDVVINEALDTLKSSVTKAVKELIELIDADREEVRRLACKDIIEYTLKSIEVESIEQRLDKVERLVLERKSYK